jgi:hypothetical protein
VDQLKRLPSHFFHAVLKPFVPNYIELKRYASWIMVLFLLAVEVCFLSFLLFLHRHSLLVSEVRANPLQFLNSTIAPAIYLSIYYRAPSHFSYSSFGASSSPPSKGRSTRQKNRKLLTIILFPPCHLMTSQVSTLPLGYSLVCPSSLR